MTKRKTNFEQIPLETVKAIVERIAAPPVAASLVAKPAVEIASERKKN